jgi:glycosyltransferase involved in cell wall biosynthesis
MLKRGHDVTVLAHQHKGDYNDVKVSNDYQRMLGNQRWDLIIVHGGDVISQNIVHNNASQIQSPVLYLIVKPSESIVCMQGLREHRFLGYSTSMDIEHLKKHNVMDKGRRIRHGIIPHEYKRVNLTDKKIFVSAGGFWPHKAMTPLAEAFTKANIPNAELHLYGYGEEQLMPDETDNVKCFFGKDKTEVLLSISAADAYIMNSYEEGFGLVLLEAMMNKTPWYARDIAGAKDMCYHGTTYNDEKELMELLRNHKRNDKKIEDAYNYVMANHTIQDTANDIEDVLLETLR